MNLTDGVLLTYITENSDQAVRLEKAISVFPARIELSDLVRFGDGAQVFVMEAGNEIVIRPRGCRISETKFEGELTTLYDSDDLKVVQYGGIKYNIMNIPLYEKGIPPSRLSALRN